MILDMGFPSCCAFSLFAERIKAASSDDISWVGACTDDPPKPPKGLGGGFPWPGSRKVRGILVMGEAGKVGGGAIAPGAVIWAGFGCPTGAATGATFTSLSLLNSRLRLVSTP